MESKKNLKAQINALIEDISIEIYCDETRSLSDELELNQHELREFEDNSKRLIPRVLTCLLERARELRTESLGRAIVYFADLESLVKEVVGESSESKRSAGE